MAGKWTTEFYDWYDYNGIVARLEQMAAEGWMIDQIKGRQWHYHKIQPQKLNFAITHFQFYTPNETAPDNGQSEFLDMCRAAGWEKIVQYESMLIFINRAENPTPLETDALTQVRTIDSSMPDQIYVDRLPFIFIILTGIIRNVFDIGQLPKSFVNTPNNLIFFVTVPIFISIVVAEFMGYNRWYKKALKMAKETGEFYSLGTDRLHRKMNIFTIILLVITFAMEIAGFVISPFIFAGAYMAMVLGAVVWQKAEKQRLHIRASARAAAGIGLRAVLFAVLTLTGNTPITPPSWPREKVNGIAVYNDQMPLTLEDLSVEIDEGKSCSYKFEKVHTFLFDRYEGEQAVYDENSDRSEILLSYKLIKSGSGFMDSLQKSYGRISVDPLLTRPWQAERAEYLSTIHRYTVYYEDALLVLYAPCLLTEQQTEIIVERLVNRF